MKNNFFIKAILLLVLTITFAYSKITVTFTGGVSYVERGDSKIKIKAGDVLKNSDIVITGSSSFVILKTDDDSIFKVLSNTAIKLDYYSSTPLERKGKFTLLKGKIFSFISKVFKESKVKIISKEGFISVRGTSFLMESMGNTMKVHLTEGRLAVFENENSSRPLSIINAGQSLEKTQGSSKVIITPLSEESLRQANEEIPSRIDEFNFKKTKEKEVEISQNNKQFSQEAILSRLEKNLMIKQMKQVAFNTVNEMEEVVNIAQETSKDLGEVKNTINGMTVKQTYTKRGDSIIIGSVTGDKNSFNLRLNYNNTPASIPTKDNNYTVTGKDLKSSVLTLKSDNYGTFAYHNGDIAIDNIANNDTAIFKDKKVVINDADYLINKDNSTFLKKMKNEKINDYVFPVLLDTYALTRNFTIDTNNNIKHSFDYVIGLGENNETKIINSSYDLNNQVLINKLENANYNKISYTRNSNQTEDDISVDYFLLGNSIYNILFLF